MPRIEGLFRIDVAGITAYGWHGVLPHEREHGQAFRVDVSLWLDAREAADNDDLGKTVNYADVSRLVKDHVVGDPCDLIEALAQNICLDLLSLDAGARIEQAEVTVHKLHAPGMGVAFSDVAVTVRGQA